MSIPDDPFSDPHGEPDDPDDDPGADPNEEFEKAYALLDRSYPRRAYRFLLTGLGRIMGALERPRHISGAELLDGLCDYALTLYGPLAPAVLAEWNVDKPLDFGRMVFSLVDNGLLGKTEEDSLDDFARFPRFHRLAEEWEPLSGFRDH